MITGADKDRPNPRESQDIDPPDINEWKSGAVRSHVDGK